MVGAPPAGSTQAHNGARGLRALTPALRQVRWPPKFTGDAVALLRRGGPVGFPAGVRGGRSGSRGDGKVMAN